MSCQHCKNKPWTVETGCYMGSIRLCSVCFDLFRPARHRLKALYYQMVGEAFRKAPPPVSLRS